VTVTAVPRHRRIEQAVRERIAALRPGDPLPSDSELCAEFGVSRMTARNAMQRLADEGLIHRHRGRGSFVAEPPAHRRADRLMSFTSEMRRRGRVPSSRIAEREMRPANPAEAMRLGVEPGVPITFLRRVRCADGEPVALETAVLARDLSIVVMAADLRDGSLHAALAAAGHHLRSGSATISAEAAGSEDARLLGVPVGAPMLVERRVILDTDGRAVEATESRYRPDHYAIDVSFDVDDAGVG